MKTCGACHRTKTCGSDFASKSGNLFLVSTNFELGAASFQDYSRVKLSFVQRPASSNLLPFLETACANQGSRRHESVSVEIKRSRNGMFFHTFLNWS